MDQHQQVTKASLYCPRCNSTDTKFCYYNNYSLSQPRHFCKACKRYWTRGGTLRNVPVGGGCRKNGKRIKNRVASSSSTSTLSPILGDAPLPSSNQVPQIHTSTVPAASLGASTGVLTPLSFGCYNDLMIHQQQQPSKIYSDMNTSTDHNPTDAAFFSSFNNPLAEYHTSQNATPQYSTSRSQANQLLERLFPFQTMQHQEQQSISIINHIADKQQQQQQHAKRWISNHDPHNSSIHTWRGNMTNVTPWPPM